MKNQHTKRRLRKIFTWAAWVLLAQIVLMNISAVLYAHKFTHLYTADDSTFIKPVSNNVFAKTWRLFSGPKFYRKVNVNTPDSTFTPVFLKTTNDIPLNAWYGTNDTASLGTVILFHGLMGNKEQVMPEAIEFMSMGYNVMLVDSRGHGGSGGHTTTIGYYEAEEVKLAYDYILQKGEKHIFLWGASMGAVQVIKAVADYALNPVGIIVEMPFLSLQSHLKARARLLGFPEQPFAFLTSFWIGAERGFNGLGFKTTRYAKSIQCPVLMQYGKKDKLVLPEEAEAVFRAIGAKNKKLVLYDEAGHTQLLRQDPATWRRETESFLNGKGAITF